MTRRSAEWLLARVLRDHAELDMVLGDLSEEQGRHGRLWYWREIASIAAHAAFRPRAVPTPQASRNGAMNGWINDVRYAWRSICHRPLVTLTIVTTLALGLGANAAIFNFIDRIVLHPYPVPDPDRVVMVAATGPGIDVRQHSVALADFYDWRQSSQNLFVRELPVSS